MCIFIYIRTVQKIVMPPTESGALGELIERSLADAVWQHARETASAGHRRDVNNRALLGNEMSNAELRKSDHTLHVHVHRVLVVLHSHGLNRATLKHTGTVHLHIKPKQTRSRNTFLFNWSKITKRKKNIENKPECWFCRTCWVFRWQCGRKSPPRSDHRLFLVSYTFLFEQFVKRIYLSEFERVYILTSAFESSLHSLMVSSSPLSLRPTMAILEPSWENRMAVALPMPDDAPFRFKLWHHYIYSWFTDVFI